MDISVVVPVYGCRAALHELHRRLVESVSTITDDFEIILVNDACPQNSWEVIEEICKEDSRVKGIDRTDRKKSRIFIARLRKVMMWSLPEEHTEKILS